MSRIVMINGSVMLPSTSWYPKCFLPFRFSDCNCAHNSLSCVIRHCDETKHPERGMNPSMHVKLPIHTVAQVRVFGLEVFCSVL
jgi:hypothetical protein